MHGLLNYLMFCKNLLHRLVYVQSHAINDPWAMVDVDAYLHEGWNTDSICIQILRYTSWFIWTADQHGIFLQK